MGTWCLLRKNRCFHAFMPSALPFWLEIFLIFPKKKVSFRPNSKNTTYVKPLLREEKKKKKKSLTVEEVFFPADCKCSFLCCFLNDLGNFRNHKTINTYIHFFCFGSMCKVWQEQLLFIFRSPEPTILLLKKTVIFLKCMTSQICKYQRIKAGGPLCFIQFRHFRMVKN